MLPVGYDEAMKKRTAIKLAVVVAPLTGILGLIFLVFLMPSLFATLRDLVRDEGPWDLQFPAEDRASVLSEARPLGSRGMFHGVGTWFARGPALLEGGDDRCRAISAEFMTLGEIPITYDCKDIVDLGEDAQILVALIAETPAPFGQVAVGLSSDGQERWRFTPSESVSLEPAAPLYDEEGLYGVAFGPGGDEGIVAVDLDGKRLWQIPEKYVIYGLSSHRSLPGKLYVFGGDWIAFEHDREGVRAPGGGEQAADRQRSLFSGYLWCRDGVAFPGSDGSADIIVVGKSIRGAPRLSRYDEQGKEVWQAVLSEQAKTVVLVGTRRGRSVFAIALEDRTIVVFDEDGTLLDLTTVPLSKRESEYFAHGFDGGEVQQDLGMITIDTSSGKYLYRVDLGD